MAASDARPVPRKNTAFRLSLAVRKTDGTLITTWAGMDSEVSLDGAAFADCTNEATEIGSSGCGYIDFTAAEMNADSVIYKLTLTNTNALPVVLTFWPEETGDYRTADDFTATQKTSITTAATAATPIAASVAGAVGSVVGLTVGNLDATVSSRATPTQVNTEVDTALVDVGLTTTITGRIDAATSTRSSHSAADVWSVGTRSLTTFGTLVADVATAVWGSVSRTLTAFGFTTTPSNAADTTAIREKTEQLTFTVANQVDANALTGGGGLTADQTRAALGMAAADLDDQIDGILTEIAAIDTGAGTGPHAITFTVIDAGTSDPIEGATVRMERTGEPLRAVTDVDGIAAFGATANTFVWAISAAGYIGDADTIVVTADDDLTVELTATSYTPSDPAQTTGTITVYTAGHVAVAGAVVEVEITRLANGTTGSGISDPLTSQTTDSSGFAQFAGLPRLATYRVRIDGGKWTARGVTLDAAETPLAGTLGTSVED